MKMGNIASPWRYDVAACVAPQSPKPRQLAILRYASRVVLPHIRSIGLRSIVTRMVT
jgi:hypothetical protein